MMNSNMRLLISEGDLDLSPATDIPALGMAVAAVPILTVAVVSLFLKLGNVQTLLISASRCVVQLLILGLILAPVFRNNQIYVVFPYVLAMMLFATREASLKPKLHYVGMRFNMFASILSSTALWLTVIIFGVLKPAPWWDAQVVIPVAGMMLGSSINALSLGMDRFLSSIRGESGNGSALLQTYMNCGATKWEMSLPSIRQGIETGLTPNLNQMSVMGLVSIPGMLTGQILAGTSPFVAAKYQIVIMFFICSNSTTILLSTLCQAVYWKLFDHDRFHSKVIQEHEGGKPKDWVLALCSKAAEVLRLLNPRKGGGENGDKMHSDDGDVECTSFKTNDESDTTTGTFQRSNGAGGNSGGDCLLQLTNGSISHGGLTLLSSLSLSLQQGEIVMVTGPSGCGKSSFLRALALLEPLDTGELEFRGEVPVSSTAWRNEVLYVRQSGGQGLSGTPNELLASIFKFHSQYHRLHVKDDIDHREDQAQNYLLEFLETVGLPAETKDFRWDRLSGGEAQRAYLCVMLALRPTILLLDEPTSACDEQAAIKVEELITSSGIAALWVSHDPAQMERLLQYDQTSCLEYHEVSNPKKNSPYE